MKRFGLTVLIFTLTAAFLTLKAQEQKSYDLATIAFYNLENLFDTIVDPDPNKILQDEFTPKGKNMWNTERYTKKLDDMSRIIAEIGAETAQTAPMIVGISEVENELVIQDLVNHPNLKKYNYGIVHYESPDRRGIDVALIYRKEYVQIRSSASKRLYYPKKDDFRTRDQLVVEADLQGESIYILVNHWPSRRGGEKRSSPLREAAAELSRSIADSLTKINADAKIIIMGDFNDDPTDKSVKKVLNTSADKTDIKDGQFYNPMEKKYKAGNGTGAYNDSWNLFDQLIVSKSLVKSDDTNWKYYKAKIHKNPELIQQSGKYKNYPKRTFSFGSWVGGYSDHFPIYLYLIREQGEKSFQEPKVNNSVAVKTTTVQNADVPKPEFFDQPYIWLKESNKLIKLSKEDGNMKSTVSMKASYKYNGDKSKTEVIGNSGTSFLINTTLPTSLSALVLCKLDVKEGKFRYVEKASSSYETDKLKNIIPMDYKKIEGDLYELVLSHKLTTGEYVITNGLNSFTFSIKKSYQ